MSFLPTFVANFVANLWPNRSGMPYLRLLKSIEREKPKSVSYCFVYSLRFDGIEYY